MNKQFKTLSGLPVKDTYTSADLDRLELGNPGEFPYTRGVYKTMYRGRLWTMREFSGFGTAKETNLRYRYLLESGSTGLSVAFHLPTLMGRDSDDPKSLGEIGKCGVAVDSLRDMEILFSGIDLEKITTSMTINAPACILLAMYLVVAEKQGADWRRLGGTIQNDILKEYIAQKTYIFPPLPSIRLITDIFDFCIKEVPNWHPISVSGYHIREAGASAIQELAFTLASGLHYLYSARDAGIDIAELLPRVSFFFNSHNDFFEEIAKFRAARRLWAKEVKERFDINDEAKLIMKFHVQNAGSSLTSQQPYNNIARTAIQTLAGVLGGAQSIHTNSYDEALALPGKDAVTVALRTQQIIAHETGITQVIDPLGGSYYLEYLTNRLEDSAKEYIKRIDEMGGMVSAIEKGFPQREIMESAVRYQREVDSKERIIVGVNEFIEKEKPIRILKVQEKTQREQVSSVKRLKRERNRKRWEKTLGDLRETAKSHENIMPAILSSVRAYATVGEICNVLKEVFGEYKEPNII